MGNICGKQEDPYAQPGRRVGSTPAGNTPSSGGNKSVPVPKKVGGPGRTLGGSTQDAGAAGADDARRRAAEAAEARAKGTSKPAGKLQTQLNAQKKQTRSDTLKDASNQELRNRDADQAAQARNWD